MESCSLLKRVTREKPSIGEKINTRSIPDTIVTGLDMEKKTGGELNRKIQNFLISPL